MIPNITRGGSTVRLMRYLVGKGRGGGERPEVHVDPHLVAGEPGQVMVEHWGQILEMGDTRSVAEFLDEPMHSHGVEITTAVKDAEGKATGERKAAHVWHCSLSLHPDEPALQDDYWQELARAYIDRLGFGRSASQAGCRWVAVRHGRSSGGNDHIHLVVNLVREDGTKASVHLDRPRAQQACRELEQQFGLRPVEGRERGAGERGFKPGELAADVDGGLEPASIVRRQLERIVRACSTAAVNEADFIARLRAERVLVRPRFAQASQSDVEGYSVALAPEGDGKPIWFGGGRLSRELTLPRLRVTWPELDQATITAAWQSRRAANSTRTQASPSPAVQADAARQLQALRDRLAGVRHDDRSAWALVARDTAGVLAALSLRTEPTPGPIAEAGRAVARSAQLRAVNVPGRPMRVLSPTQNAAAVFLGASSWRRSPRAMVSQLTGLVRALCDMHQAAGELDRARDLELAAVARLDALPDGRERGTRAQVGVTRAETQRPLGPPKPDHDIER